MCKCFDHKRVNRHVCYLSLGLKVLYKTFPDGMLTGQVPKTCLQTPTKSGHTRKPLSSSSSTRDRPLSTSSALCDIGSHIDRFSMEDLTAIQEKLDTAFLSSEMC